MNNRKKPTPRKYSGSATAAVDAVKQAAAGWPPMPKTLRASEKTYWDAIMIARLPSQWAHVDLLHAANLARCEADIDEQREAVLREGTTIEMRFGPSLNPRLALIDSLNRRAMSLTRVLQLQAVATIGAAQKHVGTKADAAAAAAVLQGKSVPADVDALLARPRMQ